jgi:hypothetical protein
MEEQTPIDRLYDEASRVIEILARNGETSLQIAVGENFRKTLLLAAASHFENRVCGVVLDFVSEKASGSVRVAEFFRNKAIARQYHTWFKWDDKNANQFFGLFGPEFRALMKQRVNASEDLDNSIKAFLEIGNERNRLLHQDYATFPLEKTMDEIYQLYKTASLFLQQLSTALRESDGVVLA